MENEIRLDLLRARTGAAMLGLAHLVFLIDMALEELDKGAGPKKRGPPPHQQEERSTS